MPATSAHLAGLSEQDRLQLESWLVEFDESWHDGHVDAWAKKLAGHPLRRPALLEMVKIELERQWAKGRRPVLEAYLKTYPELGTPATVPAKLIQLEFELRKEHSAPAGPELIDRRFPGRRAEIERLAQDAADSELRIGQAVRESLADPNSTMADDRVMVMPSSLPEQFGRYHILRKLGRGGMGSVYLAHDDQLDRRVALKVPHFLPTDDPDILERFRREAKAAATLQHANICAVYDVGAHSGVHFLTMAFIEGKPLSEIIKESKALPQRQAAEWVRQLALALQEAHDMGVIHRDLKPANIMINRRQEPVVMDFGLARRAHAGDIQLTHAGSVLGTPAYMSPEQVRGDLPNMGPGCDIYSLGVILYECLTGRPPFSKPGMGILTEILHDEPELPSRLRADLEPALERICRKAMAKKIEDRYPTMKALAADLGEYLTLSLPAAATPRPMPAAPGAMPVKVDTAVAPGPPPVIPASSRTSPSRRTLAAFTGEPARQALARVRDFGRKRWRFLAGLAAALFLVLLVVAVLSSRRPEDLRAQADAELEKGKEALANHEPDTAVAALSRVIDLDPDRAEAYHLRGRAYLQQHDFTAAVDDFTRCLDLQPKQVDVLIDRGRARAGMHDLAGARREFDGIINYLEATAEAYVERAKIYIERGFITNKPIDYNKAIADCTSALEKHPGLAIALAVRGAARIRRGDYARAAADCTEALKLDDRLPLAYAMRGRAALDKKDPAPALQDCNRALQLDPQLQNGYLIRGQLQLREHRLDKALADFDKAVQLDPRDAIAYWRRGTVRYGLRDDGLAIKDFDKALKLQPEFALAYNARANAHSFMKNYAAALADHKRAIKLDPDRNIYLVNRGLTYMRMKQYDKAAADMKKLIDSPPFDAAAYYGLGLICQRQKKHSQAEIQFHNAITQAPRRVEYRYALGQLLDDMKETDRAEKAFQEGLAMDPGHAGCLAGMGRILAGRKQYREAVLFLDKAIASDSRDPAFYLDRSRAYEALGEIQKSLADAKHAAKLEREQATPSTELTAAHYHALGKAYAANNNHRDAVNYFSQAISRNADEPAYYLDRAAAHARLGNETLASQDRATAARLQRK